MIEKFWLSLEAKSKGYLLYQKQRVKLNIDALALTVDKNEYEIRPHTDIIGKLFTIIFYIQRIQSKETTIILEPDFIH